MDFLRTYSRPLLYDIAFDFRDVPREVEALSGIFRRHAGREARSFLELACGPGRHARAFARRGGRAVGLDLAPEMIDFARDASVREGVSVEWLCADMLDFSIPEPVDLAVCLMDSLAHVLRNEDLEAHLACVHAALAPGGLYVPELSHPANHFGTRSTAQNHWTMERDGLRVETTFGLPDDPFDPITEITETTVVMSVEPIDDRAGGAAETHGVETQGVETFRTTTRIRRWTHQTLRAILARSPHFEPVAWLGSLDADIPFDNAKAAWRMVPVLRKPLPR